ncbi:GGDEF domain-containing protein [Blastopirellula sp. JC732]|uniref:diguanylate cyclase n=1 Tax=Blastopirellula sediminis TaxID=2894196 RepID=A0A9X1MPF3_9BACT|nr:GGDEF domain-containing protein [Blastopirellula sediminis]MCC9605777.1 GGDEF domain-containing protein [Blastopirellula sediminis]MCC9630923.1 GGDEF domain-containing protein [Blastopirellula sediminis]
MENWMLGIPVPVALALVALIGYFLGKRNASAAVAEQSRARREVKRAQAVIRQLEDISRDIRRNLATHQSSILHFKERINELGDSQDTQAWQNLCEEAEQMLSPTMRLSSQIANAYDEIRQQANLLMTFTESRTDPLTGLSNRRALDDSLENLIAMKGRYDFTFSLCIFDVDHFKRVNDQHGHLHGDRVLVEVSNLIDNCVRETDIVTRYGGEEFVVLMPSTDIYGACIFAERLRTSAEAQLGVTISGGLSQVRSEDEARTLLARADAALYRAKANGRNCNFYHDGTRILPCLDIDPDAEAESIDEAESLLLEVRELEQLHGAGAPISEPSGSPSRA